MILQNAGMRVMENEEAGFVVSVIDGDIMPAEIVPVVGPADYDSNKLFVGEKPI